MVDSRKHEFFSVQKLLLSGQFGFLTGWNSDGPPTIGPNWIPEAVTSLLLYHNLDDFTVQNIHGIGDKAFLIIFKAIIALEYECHLIGLSPPNINNIAPTLECTVFKYSKCKCTWVKVWRKYILPHIFHPFEPTSFSIIQSFVYTKLLGLDTDISSLCTFSI
jgi:hypothetical protein